MGTLYNEHPVVLSEDKDSPHSGTVKFVASVLKVYLRLRAEKRMFKCNSSNNLYI